MCSGFRGVLSLLISLGSLELQEKIINLLQHLPVFHCSLDCTGEVVCIYALNVTDGRRAIPLVDMRVTAGWLSPTNQPEK